MIYTNVLNRRGEGVSIPADVLTLLPGPSPPDRILLTSICRPRRGPQNLDKPSKTRENRRSRGKCEDQDMLTSILNVRQPTMRRSP